MKKVYAHVIVCERVLSETDGVMSAIRIADLFIATTNSEKPLESQAIPMSLSVAVRTTATDDSDHWVQLILTRPDGEESPMGEPIVAKITSKIPPAPGGFNIAAQVGVVPKQWGVHTVSIKFDGEIVAETVFTLVRQQDDAHAGPMIEGEHVPLEQVPS